MRLSKPVLCALVLVLYGVVLLVKYSLGLRTAFPSGHTPRVCEDLGYELPGSLASGLRRSFRRDELRTAHEKAGLGIATRQPNPMAVWLVGPSATGKSFMATDVALDLGIAALGDGNDAVLVDGHMFRVAHGGYQAVVKEGSKLRCVWRQAYPSLREQLQRQKERLLREAARRRLNVIIPHTCYDLSECVSWLHSLHRHGYKNHVVMVLGDRNVVELRGIMRARSSGKRYAPEEWNVALNSGFQMIALATGYAELVWTTPKTRWIVRRGKPSDVLAEASEHGWYV